MITVFRGLKINFYNGWCSMLVFSNLADVRKINAGIEENSSFISDCKPLLPLHQELFQKVQSYQQKKHNHQRSLLHHRTWFYRRRLTLNLNQNFNHYRFNQTFYNLMLFRFCLIKPVRHNFLCLQNFLNFQPLLNRPTLARHCILENILESFVL